MDRTAKFKTSPNTSSLSSITILRCKNGEKKTGSMSLRYSRGKLTECEESIKSFIYGFSSCLNSGSGGCIASFKTSETVSDKTSDMPSMNYQTRSTRHTIVRWKRLASKNGNTHTGSSNVSQQLLAHFASRSSQSSSHSISTQIQHPHSRRIGARRTQHMLCDPYVPVYSPLSMWMDRPLSNSRIFRSRST